MTTQQQSRLVFLWAPREISQVIKNERGERCTIITLTRKAWLKFARRYELGDRVFYVLVPFWQWWGVRHVRAIFWAVVLDHLRKQGEWLCPNQADLDYLQAIWNGER